MRVSFRLAAALVAALGLGLAGCGSEDPTVGSVSVVVTSTAAVNGMTGNLIVEVRDSGFDLVASDNSLYARTLAEGAPLVVPTFVGMSPGTYSVFAFLDRDGDLVADAGDVAATGIYLAEVQAGGDSLVVVTLSYVP